MCLFTGLLSSGFVIPSGREATPRTGLETSCAGATNRRRGDEPLHPSRLDLDRPPHKELGPMGLGPSGALGRAAEPPPGGWGEGSKNMQSAEGRSAGRLMRLKAAIHPWALEAHRACRVRLALLRILGLFKGSEIGNRSRTWIRNRQLVSGHYLALFGPVAIVFVICYLLLL